MSDPDLRALRELRDRNAETALGADQRARIRARVQAAVTTPRDAGPTSVEPFLEAEPVSLGGPAEVAPMPARSRRLLLAAAAIVAVCALAALLATRRTAPSTTEVISQPPTMTIGGLAERARAQPDHPLGTTDFEHITTETGRALNPYDVSTRGLWAGTQGQGRETLANETRERPTGAGTLRYPATDRDINTPFDGVNTAGAFTYEQLRGFPTRPAELEAALFQASGAPQGSENLDLFLVDVLGRPTTPPAVRAAGLLLLESHGATVTGEGEDHTGRPGTRITLADGNERHIYILGDDTRLIGTYTVPITAADDDHDAATFWVSVLESSVVPARR